jgi:hypothetical protein
MQLEETVKFCLNRQVTYLPSLNATFRLKYVLKCEQHLSFLIFRSGFTVTGLARVYCIDAYFK